MILPYLIVLNYQKSAERTQSGVWHCAVITMGINVHLRSPSQPLQRARRELLEGALLPQTGHTSRRNRAPLPLVVCLVKKRPGYGAGWRIWSCQTRLLGPQPRAAAHRQQDTAGHSCPSNTGGWCMGPDPCQLSVSEEQMETFLNFLCSVKHTLA